MAIDRKKTSLYLDRQLVQTTKMLALSSGKHEYEVIEEALREYLETRREAAGRDMLQLFEEVAKEQEREGVTPLTDDEAMELADEAVHQVRAERWEADQRRTQSQG